MVNFYFNLLVFIKYSPDQNLEDVVTTEPQNYLIYYNRKPKNINFVNEIYLYSLQNIIKIVVFHPHKFLFVLVRALSHY